VEKRLGNAVKLFNSDWLTVEKFMFFRGNLKASVADFHVELQQSKS
jgi:hypothetical protein